MPPRTLLRGGGFGGIAVATEARRLLGEDHEVVLVDRHEFFTMGLRKLWAVVGFGTLEQGSRDMLLATGRHDDAIEAYRVALERSPNRFNSLFGAGRAAELAEDRETAESFYGQLLEVCSGSTGDRPELAHAREFISTAG